MSRLRVTIPSAPTRIAAVVEKAFQALISVIIVCVIYRYCWIDISDPYKCGALLNKGQWLDPGPRWSSKNPFQNWQPPGCMMHEYKRKDIQECFKERRLVFVGDSTTRQIFWAVAKKMDQRRAEEQITEHLDLDLVDKHKDLEFSSSGVTVQFIWDPYLNSTGLDRELKSFNANPAQDAKTDESAGLILLGAPGLWYARHGQENFFKDFRDSIEHVIPFMDHDGGEHALQAAASQSFPSRRKSPNFLLLAPVQVPWYQALSPSREETITPEKIDQMNDYLQQVSAHSEADIVWSFSLMTWAGQGEYEESGLHVVDNVAHRKADVLLNLRCNADSVERGYPFDRTCCNSYRQPNAIQWLFVLVGMILLPSVFLLRRKHVLRVGRLLPQPEVLGALMTFALAICYCYYADRTQLFEKEHKQFHKREVLVASSAVLVAGLLSVRINNPSSPSKGNHEVRAHASDYGFLSRDQTDEWKGWMQFLILIYHYTHGSKTLWLFEIMRNLVAGYLFMTGYGHTMYFLRREDYSFKRVASVLIRLNMLTCALSYMMRTDYTAHYFVPLVSFWFLVVYLTLKVRQEKNSSIGFLLGKIFISAILTTAFIKIPGVLEVLAFILKYTFAISWNMQEWRYRAGMDMFIVYIGMITAILYLRLTRIKAASVICKSKIDTLLRPVVRHPIFFKTTAIVASVILLPGFRLLTERSPDREDYLWWHPYISAVPILAFVTLRNSHSILRSYHSTIFAWLGRCSLETFVLQSHIWMAADLKGILRLGVWDRWTEAALLTVVFAWVAWRVEGATEKITGWIVDGGLNGGGASGGQVQGQKYQTSHELGGLGATLKPDLLPMLEDGEGTPSKNSRFGNWGEDANGSVTGVRWWRNTIVRGMSTDLRWRVGGILVGLWIGNWVYR
ncbi:putative cas1 domain-containing protein [Botrytis cinerea BcDW1]|uniref:Putative cas1 domain-containing protein n=1 Tax=Botryotinia fuckeliana (strain BcDW1) TaxID=1290391 RepID=M7UFP2_BOTF1|nr:putative cas1 domain-containing protein [Botrytis cinerea BcDW1]